MFRMVPYSAVFGSFALILAGCGKAPPGPNPGTPPAPGPATTAVVKDGKVSSLRTVEEELQGIKKAYDQGAISLTEWESAKAKYIAAIPNTLPDWEKRTLGQRVKDIKNLYDKGVISLTAWESIKGKYLTQADLFRNESPALEQRLIDLKQCYDNGTISLTEWERTKAEMIKQSK